VVVLSLALEIGANSAIFGLADQDPDPAAAGGSSRWAALACAPRPV
jgi:hypothetical protein